MVTIHYDSWLCQIVFIKHHIKLIIMSRWSWSTHCPNTEHGLFQAYFQCHPTTHEHSRVGDTPCLSCFIHFWPCNNFNPVHSLPVDQFHLQHFAVHLLVLYRLLPIVISQNYVHCLSRMLCPLHHHQGIYPHQLHPLHPEFIGSNSVKLCPPGASRLPQAPPLVHHQGFGPETDLSQARA